MLDELIEDALDSDLRQSEEFHRIVDALIDEIEKRFGTLEVGEFRRSRQGWPTSWYWESPVCQGELRPAVHSKSAGQGEFRIEIR
ncbi:hypothetical protein [Plantactinospora sp. KBS50]|uniref:hypothetical protein n=1 Tax=Plantactinospora sp. KBS50 TaxID=2024580 RepID=UPI0018DFFCCF|nr:hypothetical protein [Plantactinospora sp. KBS50]